MLLERIVLSDIGTFRGEQSIDLRPRSRANKHRPVVLFGGLNGAGKTTLLNSIRHVLYGRQALEGAVTQKAYQEFLRGLIHHPVGQLVRPDRAHVELQFTYARLGKAVRYTVCRSWIDRGSSVDEVLTVCQDGETKPLLTGDTAQAFLSQLIPSGVSQFFFFDGEKIATLAKDESDEVLANAIRRLLGLDLADRLRSDLSVYLRGRRAEGLPVEVRKELDQTGEQIESAKAEIERAETELTDVLVPELTLARQELESRKAAFSDQGGAWAVNRKSLEQRLDKLSAQRIELEDRIREDLSGLAVFSAAPRLCAHLLEQAHSERRAAEHRLAITAVSREAKRLKSRLTSALAKKELKEAAAMCVDQWIAEISEKAESAAGPIHGYTSSDVDRLDDALTRQLPIFAAATNVGAKQLSLVLSEITEVQDTLAHTPTDESIEQVFAEYQAAASRVAALEAKNKLHVETIRLRIFNLIGLIRKAKKLEEKVQGLSANEKSEELADRIQGMISDFKVSAAEEKCRTLERHFATAFKRLARKEDIVDHASIDPVTFAVSLIDKHGRTTPKQRLSAGEKQIFAIAMLEALAKTSGRNLPIIIDTPLGRLDSKHRAKLVEGYLPFASHQVLVLSTDTEVDQGFYEGLLPSISHAFHLGFDEQEGFTTITPGYFWKHQEMAHAA